MTHDFLAAPPPDEPSWAPGFHSGKTRNSRRDLLCRVVREGAAIHTRSQLEAWVRGRLRALIPHEHALLGFGQIDRTTIRIDHHIAVDLPETYISAMHAANRSGENQIITKWRDRRVPQIISLADFHGGVHSRWIENLHRHQIESAIFDAHVETVSMRASFIKLLNPSQPTDVDAAVLAQFVTPLLARIWTRLDPPVPIARAPHTRRAAPALTTAEREVVRWLREGKTNWEIGEILGKSELTVKTQVQTMLRKTGVKNRHALAAREY